MSDNGPVVTVSAGNGLEGEHRWSVQPPERADMKKRVPLILATMDLAVSSFIGFSAAPVSAHRYDYNSDLAYSLKNPVQTGTSYTRIRSS
jgi:hypothetical protein